MDRHITAVARKNPASLGQSVRAETPTEQTFQFQHNNESICILKESRCNQYGSYTPWYAAHLACLKVYRIYSLRTSMSIDLCEIFHTYLEYVVYWSTFIFTAFMFFVENSDLSYQRVMCCI
jgi:hypothetical protein